MRTTKKLFTWLAGIASVLFLLVIILGILGTWYVNTPEFQAKAQSIVSGKLGKAVQFERVSLSIFLRPHLVFHKVKLILPGSTSGTIEAAYLYPALLPLVRGKFGIAKFRAEAPDFLIRLREKTEQQDDKKKLVTFTKVKTGVLAVLDVMRSLSPDLRIEASDGKLLISRAGRDVFHSKDIKGRLELIPDGFDLDLWGNPVQWGPFSLHGRYFIEKDRIAANDVKLTYLDSILTSRVEMNTAEGHIRSAELSLDGNIGRKTVLFFSKLFTLPPEQTVRAPLTLSNARLIWKTETDFSVAGTIALRSGPSISFQAQRSPETMIISQLTVQDDVSEASLTFKYAKALLDFSFRGNLSERTLDRLFERTAFQRGWVKGNLQAHVRLDRPGESSAQGSLEGRNFIIPFGLDNPVKVEQIKLQASNKTVTLDSSSFSWGNTYAVSKGTVKASAEGFNFDMDFSTNEVKIESILQVLGRKNNKKVEPDEEQTTYPTFLGHVRFHAKSLSYGRFTVVPVRADILLDQQGIHASITEAAICGISLPGNWGMVQEEFNYDFKPASVQQPLEAAIACFSGSERTRITGIFDLTAHLRSQGKSGDFMKSLRGRIMFTARDGEILDYPMLTKIFEVLNFTDMLRGKFPDLEKQAFSYNSITIKGYIKEGKLILREAAIDGTSSDLAAEGEIDLIDKKIDITVLVAPFETVDYIIKHIPLVSNILGNTLITIPVKVEGDLSNPTVTVLSPTAIGEGILGIMKRTLQLPFTVIKPILPEEPKHRHREQEATPSQLQQ
jgi:hypothetical protein